MKNTEENSNSTYYMKKSKDTLKEFMKIKEEMQKQALENKEYDKFEKLSNLTGLMIDYGSTRFNEGLERGFEIQKNK